MNVMSLIWIWIVKKKKLYKGNDSNKEQSNRDIQINETKRGLDEDEEMSEPNSKIIDSRWYWYCSFKKRKFLIFVI